MSSAICERCGAMPSNQFGLWDYCAHCGKNLCDKCMAQGCCGHVPADSGMDEDFPEICEYPEEVE